METFSALLAICAGISPIPGEFPAQRPVTRNFDVSLICVWINDWVNNRETVDLRRYRAHYDVIALCFWYNTPHMSTWWMMHTLSYVPLCHCVILVTPLTIDSFHRCGRQLCEVLYVFEQKKTQYLLIHAQFTRIVIFWHIGNVPPMIS